MGLKYDLQTAAKLIQSCVRKFLVRTTFLNGIAAYQLLAMGIELSFKDDYQYTVDRFGRFVLHNDQSTISYLLLTSL